MVEEHRVVGRYAPSPTGDLHFGNLRTALLAWLYSRLQGGVFLLRVEDLDRSRTLPGSAEQILRDLQWLGLDWDGKVIFQSQRDALYQVALDDLQKQNLLYSCFCSRKDIRQSASAPHQNWGVYPGSCAALSAAQLDEKQSNKAPAVRIRVTDQKVTFNDECMGLQQQNLAQEVGDFVVKRADGLFAYQLAVVVDDLAQGVTHVVRGRDLIDSTARQIYLSNKLGATPLSYCHVPLMLDKQGKRMAKRNASLSAREWRNQGRSAEQLLGELAFSLGLLGNAQPLTTGQLLDSMDFQSLLRTLRHSFRDTKQAK